MRTLFFVVALIAVTMALESIACADDVDRLLKRFHSEFVAITPGKNAFPKTFLMGGAEKASQPAQRVVFSYSFSMASFETTQELWQAIMGANPSRWKGSRNSVEMLTHDQALEFCRRATERLVALKLITKSQVVRLPTEAEWEYCARAGTRSKYSFGNSAEKLDDYGWHTGNAAGNDPPVGAKKPNAWKLYDMHGYLWEWCSDPWRPNYLLPIEKNEKEKKPRFAIRGGSWKDPAEKLTSSFRTGIPANTKDDAVGFRCVLAERKKP